VGGEKTERATSKRRNEERKKGNVFKSQEVSTLYSLVAVMFTLQLMGGFILGFLSDSFYTFWPQIAQRTTFTQEALTSIFLNIIPMLAICIFPVLLVNILVQVIATVAQTKGLVSFQKLKPKFKFLNVFAGLKKMVSMRGLVELLKSILKIVILGYVVYNEYVSRFDSFASLMKMEFVQTLAFAGDFIMSVVTSAAIIFAFIALADYIYQRWQYEKDIRMTKEEIKQEYKQTEGDPKIKGKIRQKQMQMAMGRMMQSVPDADVIIRNPTHYAVAIKYEAEKNTAPVVLAKGADLVALRIIKLAEENKVAIVENKPLARGIYETVPIEAEIPQKFFQPIAEVLAFVYSTSKKSKMPKQAKSAKSGKDNAKPNVKNEISGDRII
jgi:flagellar biosynthetic protein FlhB